MTVDEAIARYPGAITYTPGDSSELNAEIIRLMRQGAKTMTCDAWTSAEAEGMPVAGRVDIALDWQGEPALATRTLAIERIRYCDMTAERVAPQGEFVDLDDWRRGYRALLSRAGLFHEEVDLMVETFEVVEDFSHV